MIRSMYTAISAMTLHQTMMDAVSDNLANVNTPGFKASKVMFQDLFAQLQSPGSAPTTQVGGINPIQVGLGIRLGYISPVFTQGTLNSTGRSSDLAIQGDGFFVMMNGEGKRVYTREGSMQVDSDGYLVNTSTGLRIQGWTVVEGRIPEIMPGFATEDLQIPLEKSVAQASTKVALSGNLRADTSVADVAGPPVVTIPAAVANPGPEVAANVTGPITAAALPLATESGTYYDVTMEFYDSLGVLRPVTVRLTRIYGDGTQSDFYGPIADVDPETAPGSGQYTSPICSTWTMTIAPDTASGIVPAGYTILQGPDTRVSDGASSPRDPLALCDITFDNTGQVRRINGVPIGLTVDNAVATTTLPVVTIPGSNGASDTKFLLDVRNLTMLESNYNTVTMSSKNGVAPGAVMDINVAADSGEIYLLFSNGIREKLGMIAMARFTNPSGLIRNGRDQYLEGVNSGDPQIGALNTGGRGTISPGYLEGSNVDMGQEFTNVILAQRGFQASTRIVRTADEMLTELVNLKR